MGECQMQYWQAISGNDTRETVYINMWFIRMESDSLPVWGAMQRMQEMETSWVCFIKHPFVALYFSYITLDVLFFIFLQIESTSLVSTWWWNLQSWKLRIMALIVYRMNHIAPLASMTMTLIPCHRIFPGKSLPSVSLQQSPGSGSLQPKEWQVRIRLSITP